MASGASTRESSVEHRCRAVAHGLSGRLDELVAAAWEPLAAGIPTWSTLATANRAEGLRTGVRWTVEACLRALGSGREPTADERETMRSLGAAQADLGVERAQLAEGARAAVTRGYEQVVAQSRSVPDGASEIDVAALGELSRRLLTFAGVLSEEMTRGWDRRHSEGRGARHREREAAVARLLEGRTGPGAGPDDDLHDLGLDARQPCGLLVVARASPVVDDADDLEGEARALAAALPGCAYSETQGRCTLGLASGTVDLSAGDLNAFGTYDAALLPRAVTSVDATFDFTWQRVSATAHVTSTGGEITLQVSGIGPVTVATDAFGDAVAAFAPSSTPTTPPTASRSTTRRHSTPSSSAPPRSRSSERATRPQRARAAASRDATASPRAPTTLLRPDPRPRRGARGVTERVVVPVDTGGTTFLPDTTAPYPYVETPAPLGEPSSAWQESLRGDRPRLLNAEIAGTHLCLYTWQESSSASHVCVRVEVEAAAGGQGVVAFTPDDTA